MKWVCLHCTIAVFYHSWSLNFLRLKLDAQSYLTNPEFSGYHCILSNSEIIFFWTILHVIFLLNPKSPLHPWSFNAFLENTFFVLFYVVWKTLYILKPRVCRRRLYGIHSFFFLTFKIPSAAIILFLSLPNQKVCKPLKNILKERTPYWIFESSEC